MKNYLLSPAEQLIIYRKRKALTIAQMAEILKISRCHLSHIERGMIPGRDLVKRIERVTGIKVEQWYSKEGDENE